ncbi:MAG: corrinoid protein [Syntrophobacterales bacterium]|nr:MAG: corrinoid protein [Syntrophobacterales bacterium]
MATAQEYFEALVEGNQDMVKTYIGDDLNVGTPPLKILNTGLIPGMEMVGQKFRDAEIYIPEVLMAARAMHAGLDLLKPKLMETGAKPAGKIVIGTVKGDLHDIGKNLVAMMFEGLGFQVIDMGVDVPTEKFEEVIKAQKPDILALSSLLTTTMLEMKSTIQFLKKRGVLDDVKTIVGGAPVTQEFADEIEADAYGKDAVSGAEKAKELLGIT